MDNDKNDTGDRSDRSDRSDMTAEQVEQAVTGAEGTQRLYTRREWLMRHALLGGATPGMAREAVSSTAMANPDWDMDGERRTLAEWDVMEDNGNGQGR